MPTTVKCPYCGATFPSPCGTQTTCRNKNCKAILHIGSDGKIRRSEPPKK